MHVCRAPHCEDAQTCNVLRSAHKVPQPRLFGVVEAGAGEAPEVAQRRWQLERHATLQEVPGELSQEAVVAIVRKSGDARSKPGTRHGCCRARHVRPDLLRRARLSSHALMGWAGGARLGAAYTPAEHDRISKPLH